MGENDESSGGKEPTKQPASVEQVTQKPPDWTKNRQTEDIMKMVIRTPDEPHGDQDVSEEDDGARQESADGTDLYAASHDSRF